MILGLGMDVVEIGRIERLLEGPPDRVERFLVRCFTPAERAFCDWRRDRASRYAARFAAKEAVVKALGTGFANGIWVRDVGMLPNALGQPQVVYSARGRALCDRLGVGEGHLTLSDEAGLIVAVAVLLKADPAAPSSPAKGPE